MIPKIKSVPFTSVKLKDAFWLPRIAKHKIALNDCLDICEQTGRINNFRVAGKLIEGKHVGIFFNDSDVYKIIEGIAYYIQINPDAELERRADEIIRAICSSQMPDGYVNTYFTLVKPEERWTDMEMHETYCAGHMVEGALAYLQATGKSAFYDAALRFVDHIYETFFIPNRPWVTGHQEIELALFKLYRHTGNEKHRLLAQFFLDWRGRSLGVGGIRAAGCESPAYCQDDVPAENLRNVGGHAVRAMYMYTAMTDAMASSADGGKYAEALDSLWDSVVNKNMYITGGIGSTASNEGFSGDFDLPNDSAYCETCASFGLAMWSRQMFLCKGKSVYADIMEKTMYNSLLAGVSLSGNKYFYVNPLSSPGSHHRQPWHDCACCPSQVARFMPSVGGYIYAHDKSDVYIN
ncbi:MAG: glycoside hydrolase family 127 protein, partial [Defluviitaleaceae bacterium]|nr:glycoside hydrolase family 127 protein [Defluviitaleaceae bacterium]